VRTCAGRAICRGEKTRRSGDHYLSLFSTVSLYYRSFVLTWMGRSALRFAGGRGRLAVRQMSRIGEETGEDDAFACHRATIRRYRRCPAVAHLAPGRRPPTGNITRARRRCVRRLRRGASHTPSRCRTRQRRTGTYRPSPGSAADRRSMNGGRRQCATMPIHLRALP
jgi:hypothetical protein